MEQKSELAKLIEPLGKFFADGVHAGEQKGKFWAAKWVEDHAKGESPEIVKFAETVVMSIRASCEMVCIDCGHYCTYTQSECRKDKVAQCVKVILVAADIVIGISQKFA